MIVPIAQQSAFASEPAAGVTDAYQYLDDLGLVGGTPLEMVSPAEQAGLLDELAVAPEGDEQRVHTWVVGRNGTRGIAELLMESDDVGRIVYSVVRTDGQDGVGRLVADFAIDGSEVTVDLFDGDGTYLDHQTAAMAAAGCRGDNGSCVAAGVGGAVGAGCAIALGSGVFTAGITTVLAVAACGIASGAGIVSGVACGAEPPPCPSPDLAVVCGVDYCTARATYVTPLRNDHHEINFEWETYMATGPGYVPNGSDVLFRTWGAGVGQAVSIVGVGTAYEYSVTDLIWHSDIRCDTSVKVTVFGTEVSPNIGMKGKDIPPDPGTAICSDYGMPGEVT